MAQELYDLPDGWEWKGLATISKLITDGTHHSPKKQYPTGGENRYKYLTSKNVKFDGLKMENISYVDELIHDEIYNRCPPEYLDQLITKDGAMTGTCCLNTLKEPFSLLSSVALIKLKRDQVTPHFLNKFLSSPEGQDAIIGEISGAAITRTTLTKLKATQIPVPPLAEQERIVGRLDALFSRIDQTIAQLNHTQAQTQVLLISGRKHCFDGLSKKYGSDNLSSVVKINSGIALPKIFKDWEGSGDLPFYKVAQMNNDSRIMCNPEITFSSNTGSLNRIKLFPSGSVLIPKRGGAILTNKKRLLLEEASYDSNIMGLKANPSFSFYSYSDVI